MNGNFETVIRINLLRLFFKWNDEDSEDQLMSVCKNWELLHTDVYGEDFAISMFRCEEGTEIEEGDETLKLNFYRMIVFNLHDEGDPIMRELAFWTDNDEVIAMNYTGKFLFIQMKNEKRLMVLDLVNEALIECFEPESDIILMRKSREILPKVVGRYLYFFKAPKDSYIGPTHDFEITTNYLREAFEGDYGVIPGKVYDDKDKYIEKDLGIQKRRKSNEEFEDIEEEKAVAEEDTRSGIEQLNSMIGLNSVKTKVEEILAYSYMQKKLNEMGKSTKNPGYNMIFKGNPGTAKTSVARIVAKIFKENNILPDGKYLEVGRADLIAGYVGQTAMKVKDVFRKAKGGVLFIDEAYSLVDDRKSFADEAIATIVQEMENMKGEIAVIFAGYPDLMDEFLATNPGLNSRIQFTVNFPDYSVEDLLEIVKMQVKNNGFELDENAVEKIENICAEAKNSFDFGNGRFCRNLVQQAMMNYSLRKFKEKSEDYDLILTENDFVIPDSMKKKPLKRNVIGF